MKKMYFYILLGSLVVTTACGNKPSATSDNTTAPTENKKTEKYTSQDGKFKILFPEEPTVSVEKIPTEIGEVDMTLYMYEKSRQEAYMVSYSDYPAELVKGTDPMKMLNSSKKGVLENIDARVTDEKDVTMGKFPAIYFKANSTDLYLVYKMVMVNNRLFQVAIMKEGSYPDEKETKDFVDSFEFTE